MTIALYSVYKKVNGEIRPLPRNISEDIFCGNWIKAFLADVRVSYPKTDLVVVKHLKSGKVKEVKDLSKFPVKGLIHLRRDT